MTLEERARAYANTEWGDGDYCESEKRASARDFIAGAKSERAAVIAEVGERLSAAVIAWMGQEATPKLWDEIKQILKECEGE